MLRSCSMRTPQKFALIHAAIHNHRNHERHLVRRQTYKLRRSAAMRRGAPLRPEFLPPCPFCATVALFVRFFGSPQTRRTPPDKYNSSALSLRDEPAP